MTASIAHPAGRPARQTRHTSTFPFVTLPTGPGRVPVEVSLVARLGRGEGDRLFFEAQARQRRHDRFVDALDEPSAKLGSTDVEAGDATALYSFGVGSGGHPFHRHAGHRVFTAVSGSGGAQLRFSSATPDELAQDPESFVRQLRHVNVPPDCLFTVRFSGTTWHQFAPSLRAAGHPAFFALSTHTNELGGDLSDAMRARVLADDGDIPSLTELLPEAIVRRLAALPIAPGQVPTTELALDDRPGGWQEWACRRYRSLAGRVHRWRLGLGPRPGFVSVLQPLQGAPRTGSLLGLQLQDRAIHHEDCFVLAVRPPEERGAAWWLAALLEGFLDNPPSFVSRMMVVRNALVRPLGLRTSPLGCPVSSLLATGSSALFAGRFPVLAQSLADDDRSAQVILGADDRHLAFRTGVGVRLRDDGAVEFSLADRVACTNAFGRVYMALIAWTHRRLIAPAMLAHAVESALAASRRAAGSTGEMRHHDR